MPNIQDTFIARHVAQSIWHTAMCHTPKGFFGLLGETAAGQVDRAVMSVTGANTPCDDATRARFIRQTLATWQNEGVLLRGALYGSRDESLFVAVEAEVCATLPQPAAHPFLHVVISLDTKGRLDSEASVLEGQRAVFAPLIMVEDGQMADIR